VYGLPGDLSQGLLIDMSQAASSVTFGPDPLEGGTEVLGWWFTNLAYEVTYQNESSGKREITGGAVIDSGGLGGAVQKAYLPSTIDTTKANLPVGSVISVYTPDQQTLLYTTTVTDSTNLSYVTTIQDFEYLNTGIAPFLQGPIYFSYTPPASGDFNGGSAYFHYPPAP
jgi:hypothetical protein